MAEYLIQGESLTAIADEVRELSGKTASLGLNDMTSNLSESNDEVGSQADLIAQIQEALRGKSADEAIEWSENEDNILNGSISSYTNDRITKIRHNAFAYCSSLTTVSFPACTTISNSAFGYCSRLTTGSFPKCTTIGSSAFYSCSNLTTVSFPACTYIGSYAFYSCRSLTTGSFPKCTTIGSSAFYSCKNLTTASFPKCITISSGAFTYCTSLTTVSFPKCTTIGSSAFSYCTSLTTVSFPACTTISNGAFGYCSRLTTASFQTRMSICSAAFNCCYNLKSLYLTYLSVCTLSNSNAFRSTPYDGYSSSFSGTPHIYVPASLVSAYQSATNWTYFSSYFSAIENSLDWDGNYGENYSPYISFTIYDLMGNKYDCTALDGMTWGAWEDSEYNTNGMLIDYIMIRSGSFYVYATDVIIDNAIYDYYNWL